MIGRIDPNVCKGRLSFGIEGVGVPIGIIQDVVVIAFGRWCLSASNHCLFVVSIVRRRNVMCNEKS